MTSKCKLKVVTVKMKTGPGLALPPSQGAWSPRSQTPVRDAVPRTIMGTRRGQGPLHLLKPGLVQGRQAPLGLQADQPQVHGLCQLPPRGGGLGRPLPQGSCCHPGWLLDIPYELPNPHSFMCFKQDILSRTFVVFSKRARHAWSRARSGMLKDGQGRSGETGATKQPPRLLRGADGVGA